MYYWAMLIESAPKVALRQIFLFIALLLGSGVFSAMLTNTPEIHGNRAQVSTAAQMLLAISALISLYLVARSWRVLLVLQRTTVVLWLMLIGWVFLSILAGQLNTPTLVRFAGFVGNTLLGVALFTATPNPSAVFRQLCAVSALVIAINLIYMPHAHLLHWYSRGITGAFIQTNVLGVTLVTAVISSMVVLTKDRAISMRLLGCLTLLTSIWLLNLASSMTSTIVLLIIGTGYFCTSILVRYRPPLGLIALLGLVIAGLFAAFYSELLGLMGKSVTMSGRSDIWVEYSGHIRNHPLIGHGYGSAETNATIYLQVEAHNGFIQITYYTGVVGLALFLSLLARAIQQAYNQALQTPTHAAFFLCYLVGFVALNLSEVYTLSRSLLIWPIFVYATLYLSQVSARPEPTSE